MSEQSNPFTNSERFLLALSYLEASMKDDIELAKTIQTSVPEWDFTAGMTVLAQTIFVLHTEKTGEAAETIAFLRRFGNQMKLQE